MNKINNWYDHYNILIFDHIDSTSDEAKRIAKQKVNHETLIWSYVQTNGRGTKNNQWMSGPNDLTFSLLLYPKYTLKQATNLLFISSVCMLQAIEEAAGNNLSLKLKWPNDILLNGKKICGMLLETSLSQKDNNLNWLVIGVGVNIVSNPQINKQISATNLLTEGSNILPDQLLSIFMQNFHYQLNNWYNNGFALYREMWLKHAYRLNHRISIKQPESKITGKFVDLSIEGLLVIQDDYDHLHYISSGEISFED